MTDTTKKPITLEEVRDALREQCQCCPPDAALYDEWADAIDACIAEQQIYANEVKILRAKTSGTLANNLCSDHRDKQVGKPCLACEIEHLEKVSAQREGEAVAWALAWPNDIDRGTVNTNTSFRSYEEADKYASWCGDPKPVVVPLYTSPRAAVTVTEDEIDVACVAAAKAYGGTIQPADVDRIAVRAAIEAVMSKPHYEVRALYEHPASKTHAAVTVTDEMVKTACDAYDEHQQLHEGYAIPMAMHAALESVLKGK